MLMLLMAFDNLTVQQADVTFMPGAADVRWTLYQAREVPPGWPEDPGVGRWLHLETRNGQWLLPGYAAEQVIEGKPGVELLALGMTGFGASRTLGFVDDDLVIVSERWGDRYSETELDWQVRYGRWEDLLEDRSTEAALLVAQRWAYDPVQVPTWTVWGESDGDLDAGLKLNAQAHPDRLDLRIRIIDDEWTPPADQSDRAMIRSDHVEIWLDGDRQLGVDLGPEPSARWLIGEGPLPAVRWEDTVLVVGLPMALLGEGSTLTEEDLTGSYTDWVHPLGTTWPLTVVFSDADGSGQEALVASSTLRWRDPTSLGRLVLFPGAARYPRPPGVLRL